MDYNFWTDEEVLSVMIDVIDKFLIPRYMELNMKASGRWQNTLGADRTSNNSAVIKGEFYTEFLTRGRERNRDQSPEGLRRWAVWAGSTFIKDWVQAKGLSADPIAIAYSIAKNGTSWKRKGGSDLLEVLTEPATIQYVNQKLAVFARPRIAEQLRRNAREAFRNI